MIRAASKGSPPGIDPIPVAVPGAHGNACCSATMSSLAGRGPQIADAPRTSAVPGLLGLEPGDRLPWRGPRQSRQALLPPQSPRRLSHGARRATVAAVRRFHPDVAVPPSRAGLPSQDRPANAAGPSRGSRPGAWHPGAVPRVRGGRASRTVPSRPVRPSRSRRRRTGRRRMPRCRSRSP